jgi:hypothetical protein
MTLLLAANQVNLLIGCELEFAHSSTPQVAGGDPTAPLQRAEHRHSSNSELLRQLKSAVLAESPPKSLFVYFPSRERPVNGARNRIGKRARSTPAHVADGSESVVASMSEA